MLVWHQVDRQLLLPDIGIIKMRHWQHWSQLYGVHEDLIAIRCFKDVSYQDQCERRRGGLSGETMLQLVLPLQFVELRAKAK